MVRMLGPKPNAGPVIRPEPPFLFLLVRHLQPLASPDPRHSLVVHMPARLLEQRRDPPAAMATVFPSQFDDLRSQRLFTGPVMRSLSLRGSVLSQCAAGAALRYPKRLPHMVDTAKTTR